MSDVNDQLSDTSSDVNWPLDHPLERQGDDRVVFENVADQYIKGSDVTVFFTILNDIKINPDEDQIGILRVGYTNIKECLAYAPVQFTPSSTSGLARHGTATFPSSSLPVTDDEFYQFCYVLNKTKNLGLSIPFQLNCTSDDVAILSKASPSNSKSDGLFAFADTDGDDFLVVHKKQNIIEDKLRQENRQLLDINRRLELQNDEFKAKLDLIDVKSKEHSQKLVNEMQTLIASHKTALGELSSRQQAESKLRSEYEACRSLCDQYQAESAKNDERCLELERLNSKLTTEINQVRSQLSITSQFTKDQATQIIELERRLMECNESSKASSQLQASLEQQLRDLRLTSEKYNISTQGQLVAYAQQVAEKEEQINVLKEENRCLNEEITVLKVNNEALSSASEKNSELQEQFDTLNKKHCSENETAQKEIEILKNKLYEMNSIQQAYTSLKTSFTEIEKRCVKHQKSEIEVKRQLASCNDLITNLKQEVQDLTTRLADGAEEYKALFLKCTALERKAASNQQLEKSNPPTLVNNSIVSDDTLESMLRDVYVPPNETKEDPNQRINTQASIRPSLNDADGEIRNCPMCFWEFPRNMSLDDKHQHVEQHFQ